MPYDLKAQTPKTLAEDYAGKFEDLHRAVGDTVLRMQPWVTFHEHYRCTCAEIQGALGYIPMMLDPRKVEGARDQINAAYPFGGWQPFKGFTLEGVALSYAGDPPIYPYAFTMLHDDLVLVYPHAWVAIIPPGDADKFEVARLD